MQRENGWKSCHMSFGHIGRTTPHRSTGEKPFSMTYGTEVVIPLETRFPTLRTSSFTPSNNDGLLGKSLDLIEE